MWDCRRRRIAGNAGERYGRSWRRILREPRFRYTILDVSGLRQIIESLSVVVPAYNAERHIARTLDVIEAWLPAQGVPHEIIVVDDGSTDGTFEVIRRYGERARILRNEANRGKGYSVRRGVLSSNNAWVLFTDADNAIDIEHLALFAASAGKADVIIASRHLPGAVMLRPQGLLRTYLGRLFAWIVRLLALPGCSDSQCGFKLFRREAARRLFSAQQVDRFAFDVEVLLLARRFGLRVVEMPVTCNNPPESTIRPGIDSLRMGRDLLRILWRLRRGRWEADLNSAANAAGRSGSE
jgi:dolichyl-phosphate beta-glucosyltransferase